MRKITNSSFYFFGFFKNSRGLNTIYTRDGPCILSLGATGSLSPRSRVERRQVRYHKNSALCVGDNVPFGALAIEVTNVILSESIMTFDLGVITHAGAHAHCH